LIKIFIVNFYYDLIVPNTGCVGVSETVTRHDFTFISFKMMEHANIWLILLMTTK